MYVIQMVVERTAEIMIMDLSLFRLLTFSLDENGEGFIR